ncbi:MAG: hypothetical protein QW051_03520 [Candidatus Aenigmatarchaeota archaeon]
MEKYRYEKLGISLKNYQLSDPFKTGKGMKNVPCFFMLCTNKTEI